MLQDLTLTIKVTDVNDQNPVLTNTPKPLKARAEPWTKVGETVYMLTATDIDGGSNITYHIGN